MNLFKLDKTETTPEILLDPGKQLFHIRGNSRPEDVRDLFYPVVEWVNDYRLFLFNNSPHDYTEEEPLILEIDLEYFNSSSAKYLFDIIVAFKQIRAYGVPLEIAWLYDKEDIDMKEAGEDMAILAEIDFAYIPR